MNPDIARFIEHARAKGMDHATIRMLLLSAGWKEKDVARALTEQALDLPVPVPPDAGGARDAFLHLVGFSALYASAVAAINLLFDAVNRFRPDPAFAEVSGWQQRSLSAIRWNLAVLVIAFPLFLLLARLLLSEMRKQPEKSWSGIRRWLTYLTLFVASVTLGTDLVTLVFYALQGEISTRFALKVGIVAGIAGAAFAYYLGTVRMPAATLARSRMHGAFAAAGSGVALVALIWGFVIAGSPGAARLVRLDARRVDDLKAIERTIGVLCAPTAPARGAGRALEHPLPARLSDVAAGAVGVRPSIRDPETGRPYEYAVTGTSTYELCATFSAARDEDYDVRFNHPRGRACFTFDALDRD